MIETNSGQALVHPQLPEPESFEENPVFIEISTLETGEGKMSTSSFEVVYLSMLLPVGGALGMVFVQRTEI